MRGGPTSKVIKKLNYNNAGQVQRDEKNYLDQSTRKLEHEKNDDTSHLHLFDSSSRIPN